MAMYVWLGMAMYVWLGMAMYVWLCLAMSGYAYMTVSGHVWLCMDVYLHVSITDRKVCDHSLLRNRLEIWFGLNF